MKQLIEFIPVALFVVVYFSTRDIYLATGVLMVGIVIQVIFEYWKDRRISKQTQFIFWVAMLAGGATLLFQDELFIKWKPTIVNWMFCLALLASQYLGSDNLLKKLLGGQLELPDQVWRTLNLGWSAGFFLAGVLNLLVAYLFSTDIWVTYKLVGGLGITLTYIIVTMVYLVKGGHLKLDAQPGKPGEADSTETSSTASQAATTKLDEADSNEASPIASRAATTKQDD